MELVKTLKHVQDLPEDLHWFCPRQGQDDSFYFDEDLQSLNESDDGSLKTRRLAKVAEARSRKALILDALLIFAFDGKDAAHYQEWFERNLAAQMTGCDICIREFHRGRRELVQKLEGQYEEEEVAAFLQKFDDLNIKRIKIGLSHAVELLEGVDERQRRIGALDTQALFALFEALSYEPFLNALELLDQDFQRAFKLVQTRKPLKLNTYPPAMAQFLFQPNEDRALWARQSWQRFPRPPTKSEFEWNIREPWHQAMLAVLPASPPKPYLPIFWAGTRAIIEKFDQDLITNCVRAMEIDIFKMALDHVRIDTSAFDDLLATVTHTLSSSPANFWDALGTIPPTVVIEEILNSPGFTRLVQDMRLELASTDVLKKLFGWLEPLVLSIKPESQPRACRAIVGILNDSFQKGSVPEPIKAYAREVGLSVLANTLQSLASDSFTSSFNGRAISNEALEVVQMILPDLLQATNDDAMSQSVCRILRFTIAIDIKNLVNDRNRIERSEILPPEACSCHTAIWRDVIEQVDDTKGIALPQALLLAVRDIILLDRVPEVVNNKSNQVVVKLNDTIQIVNGLLCNLLDRISAWTPQALRTLVLDSEAASTVACLLLSVDRQSRDATMELLRNATLESGRAEVFGSIITDHYSSFIKGLSIAINRAAARKNFSSAHAIVKIGGDVLGVLCNSQSGLLRSLTLTPEEGVVTERLWQVLWDELTTIFQCTESWSTQGNDKTTMQEFCRDAMDFAETLFDRLAVFETALAGKNPRATKPSILAEQLLDCPKKTMEYAAVWLRLRDEWLVEKSVALISKLLARLFAVDIRVSQSTAAFVEKTINGAVKTMLSSQQKAELQRALEVHVGHAIKTKEDLQREEMLAKRKKPTEVIDLDSWRANSSPALSTDNSETESLSKVIASQSRSVDAVKKLQAAKAQANLKVPKPLIQKGLPKPAEPSQFARKRQEEQARAKKQKEAELARLRGTANEGSGVAGIGVHGKDHAIKGASVMVSDSEDSSDDEDNDSADDELFGKKKSAAVKEYEEARARAKKEMKRGPVKKQRQIRSSRDMRARLAPDLSPLHKIILNWEYFHQGDFPPNANKEDYNSVAKAFREPISYRKTFEPLLILEAWQSFVKAREENISKAWSIKVVNRSSVDAFLEVSSTMSHAEGKDSAISEGDIVLISKAKTPATAPNDPHCLARVFRVTRKKQHLEVLYRTMPASTIISSLAPGADLYGMKVTSMIPLEREYGALLGLEYYDLCEEIVKAKPSPLLRYSDQQIQSYVGTYNLNNAQALALKSALDNDAFTLIQGPPGSGKTKTIVAIVGALLTNTLKDRGTVLQTPQLLNKQGPAQSGSAALKKMLVCAPSNAAVDELVMRFKEGVKTSNGDLKKVNVVRIGRSDAINTNVQDVMLEELVNKKLNINPNGISVRDETQKLMKEHQLVSEQLRSARDALERADSKDSSRAELQRDFDALRRKKALLSTQVDTAKDNENAANRQAELNRKRAQQEVIDQAHVICATLSGSGHDMFQNLNVDFETVIIDEAAQCVELSCLIPLKYGCAKCILVGDPQQLPPTVLSKQAAQFKYEQSLFVRMQANFPEDVHLLDTQYRMHPEISMFPSKEFYDSRLLDGKDMAILRRRPWHAASLLGPFRFFDVQGQHQAAPKGHSLVNYAEIAIARDLYHRLTDDFRTYDFKGHIGIITPYKSQLRELKASFVQKYGQAIFDTVEFNTTDAFQGRECEIIIFSCVRASPAGGIGFLQDIRRMNVGLTRAKSSLWVLGNSQSLLKGEFWAKLIKNARQRDRYTEGNLENLLSRRLEIDRAQLVKAATSTNGVKGPTASQATDMTKPEAPRRSHTIPISRPAPERGSNLPADHAPRNQGSTNGASSTSIGTQNRTDGHQGLKTSTPSHAASNRSSPAATNATMESKMNGHSNSQPAVPVLSDSSSSSEDDDEDTDMPDAPLISNKAALVNSLNAQRAPAIHANPNSSAPRPSPLVPRKRKEANVFIQPKKRPRP